MIATRRRCAWLNRPGPRAAAAGPAARERLRAARGLGLRADTVRELRAGGGGARARSTDVVVIDAWIAMACRCPADQGRRRDPVRADHDRHRREPARSPPRLALGADDGSCCRSGMPAPRSCLGASPPRRDGAGTAPARRLLAQFGVPLAANGPAVPATDRIEHSADRPRRRRPDPGHHRARRRRDAAYADRHEGDERLRRDDLDVALITTAGSPEIEELCATIRSDRAVRHSVLLVGARSTSPSRGAVGLGPVGRPAIRPIPRSCACASSPGCASSAFAAICAAACCASRAPPTG